jgi:hypothetical protein
MDTPCVSQVPLSDSLPDSRFDPAAEDAVQEAALPPPIRVPTPRDLEIYDQVVVARMSQREVAEIHGISQPRVHQVLREMAAWVADNTPGFAAGLSPEQRLRLVHYNVTRQLEHHQECLMEAWRESIGDEVIRRTSKEGGVARTHEVHRRTNGNPRYLREASRLSLQMLKAGGWSPGSAVPDAPQDSPYWQMAEESGGRGQESGVSGQESEEEGTVAEDSALSSFEAPMSHAQRTPAAMDCVTSQREAVYAATTAQLEQLRERNRELENTLSLGAGPLLPADDVKEPKRQKSRREGDKTLQRQVFLHHEQPPTSVKEAIRQTFRLAET